MVQNDAISSSLGYNPENYKRLTLGHIADLHVCVVCGSTVLYKAKHDAWHRWLNALSLNPEENNHG